MGGGGKRGERDRRERYGEMNSAKSTIEQASNEYPNILITK
jgi:hypothetical protein